MPVMFLFSNVQAQLVLAEVLLAQGDARGALLMLRYANTSVHMHDHTVRAHTKSKHKHKQA